MTMPPATRQACVRRIQTCPRRPATLTSRMSIASAKRSRAGNRADLLTPSSRDIRLLAASRARRETVRAQRHGARTGAGPSFTVTAQTGNAYAVPVTGGSGRCFAVRPGAQNGGRRRGHRPGCNARPARRSSRRRRRRRPAAAEPIASSTGVGVVRLAAREVRQEQDRVQHAAVAESTCSVFAVTVTRFRPHSRRSASSDRQRVGRDTDTDLRRRW